MTTAEQQAHGSPGYALDKEACLKRLRRIEGQVRGIARMVEEDQYCIDILTQMAAINKALHAVSAGLLEQHLGHCVVGAVEAAQNGEAEPGLVEEKISEASAAVSRLLRS